jgi:hypothetical protein
MSFNEMLHNRNLNEICQSVMKEEEAEEMNKMMAFHF